MTEIRITINEDKISVHLSDDLSRVLAVGLLEFAKDIIIKDNPVSLLKEDDDEHDVYSDDEIQLEVIDLQCPYCRTLNSINVEFEHGITFVQNGECVECGVSLLDEVNEILEELEDDINEKDV